MGQVLHGSATMTEAARRAILYLLRKCVTLLVFISHHPIGTCSVRSHNENPKPFKWSKTADKILASVKRFYYRAENTYVVSFRFR